MALWGGLVRKLWERRLWLSSEAVEGTHGDAEKRGEGGGVGFSATVKPEDERGSNGGGGGGGGGPAATAAAAEGASATIAAAALSSSGHSVASVAFAATALAAAGWAAAAGLVARAAAAPNGVAVASSRLLSNCSIRKPDGEKSDERPLPSPPDPLGAA